MTGSVGVSDFPGALDSHTTLVQVKDGALTTVGAGGINASVTTIPATSTGTFSPTGAITIEGEHVKYASVDSTHFLGCTRGAFTALGGGAAASHAAGAVIKQLVIAATHEVQNDAIIATQTKVGSGASTPASAKYLRGTGAGTSAWSDIASGDVATALGYTPAEGVVVQEGGVTKVANATTENFDSAYFTVTESPAKKGNVTLVSGALQDAGTLAIAAGVVTLPAVRAIASDMRITIDTESAAAADDLDTINATGSVPTGTKLVITTLSSSRDVTVKNGTGNIILPDGDFILGTTNHRLMLVRSGTSWVEVARQPLSTTYQVLDGELSAIAGLTSAADRLPYFTGLGAAALATFTAAGRALVDDADAAAQRTTLGLVIGTDVQAFDADLAAIAGLTSAADRLAYFTGSGAAALATLTAFARTLIDDADAAAMRATIGTQPGSGTFLLSVLSAQPWTNMPAALTVIFGSGNGLLLPIDLSHATEFRLLATMFTAGSAGAKLRALSSGADLADTPAAGDVSIAAVGNNFGTWTPIKVSERVANASIALYGIGGDAAADPAFLSLRIEIR